MRESVEDGHDIGTSTTQLSKDRGDSSGNGASRCTASHLLARPRPRLMRCQKLRLRIDRALSSRKIAGGSTKLIAAMLAQRDL